MNGLCLLRNGGRCCFHFIHKNLTTPMQDSHKTFSTVHTPKILSTIYCHKDGGILFDFDGTLADTAPGIVATLRASFETMGCPVPPQHAMVQTIGLPLPQAFSKLGNFSEEETVRAVSIYTELFMKHEIPSITLFPNVKDTLATLYRKGVRMAIVTSRNRHSLELILKQNHIGQFFDTNVTFDDGITPKPAPDMVEPLIHRMGLSPDRTLVVGDTTFDIEMGNRAGCHTCAVTYGNHDLSKLQSALPDFIINRFEELT